MTDTSSDTRSLKRSSSRGEDERDIKRPRLDRQSSSALTGNFAAGSGGETVQKRRDEKEPRERFTDSYDRHRDSQSRRARDSDHRAYRNHRDREHREEHRSERNDSRSETDEAVTLPNYSAPSVDNMLKSLLIDVVTTHRESLKIEPELDETPLPPTSISRSPPHPDSEMSQLQELSETPALSPHSQSPAGSPQVTQDISSEPTLSRKESGVDLEEGEIPTNASLSAHVHITTSLPEPVDRNLLNASPSFSIPPTSSKSLEASSTAPSISKSLASSSHQSSHSTRSTSSRSSSSISLNSHEHHSSRHYREYDSYSSSRRSRSPPSRRRRSHERSRSPSLSSRRREEERQKRILEEEVRLEAERIAKEAERVRIEAELRALEDASKVDQLREERRARWKKVQLTRPPADTSSSSQQSLVVETHPPAQDSIDKDDDDSVNQIMNSDREPDSTVHLSNLNDVDEIDMFDGITSDTGLFVEDRPEHMKRQVREAEPSDDTEGYYRFQLGEVLHNRYQVTGFHGQGVFSNVLRATDLSTNEEVAIKLLRNNDHMKRAGRREIEILQRLREGDPHGRYNNVRLIADFVDREHLCLVFEKMQMNLRQLIKKTGGKGLSIDAIRVYAFHLLKALIQLKRAGIIHADLKPDNILVSTDYKLVKVADLGSAIEAHECEPTPLLVSRFYRAPEIVVGMKYGHPLDMFSYGCVLYEMATGKPAFRSRDNNHHLKLILEAKGTPKIYKQGVFRSQYFDDNLKFLETVIDQATNKEIIRVRDDLMKPTRSISNEIIYSYAADMKVRATQLADLIEKCLELDTSRRLTPAQAIKHPFFS